MSNAQRWQNRIVGHGEEAPDQLLAHPLNFRIHPTKQKEALAGAIEDVGFIRSVTVNRLTGRVIDGHLRVALAIQTGQPSIPVEYVELSESEEAEALATLDPLAALAATDAEQLDALLREVQTGNAAVQAMLAELAEGAGLLQLGDKGNGDEGLSDLLPASQFLIVVECQDEAEQVGLLERFGEEGIKCRALVS